MSHDPFSPIAEEKELKVEYASPQEQEVDHLRGILSHLSELEKISPEAKARVMAFVGSIHGAPKVRRGRPPKS